LPCRSFGRDLGPRFPGNANNFAIISFEIKSGVASELNIEW
jgi:hypothetical protein